MPFIKLLGIDVNKSPMWLDVDKIRAVAVINTGAIVTTLVYQDDIEQGFPTIGSAEDIVNVINEKRKE